MNASTPPPLLLSAHTGGVLKLILNRPQARNALSSELMAADPGGAGRRRPGRCHPRDRDRRRRAGLLVGP